MLNFQELFGVLVGFLVSLLRLLLGGVFVLALCTGCSLQTKGGSSGSIGLEGYQALTWTEQHDFEGSADSPLLAKALDAVVDAAVGDGD